MLTTLLLTATMAPALHAPAPQGVEWFQGSLDQAIAQARENDSHVLVYFWRNGSDHCGALYQQTLQHDKTGAAMGDVVCLSANYDEDAGGKLFATFNVSTLPTMLFLAPDGKPDDAIAGFIAPEDFHGELARIRSGEGTLRGLTAAAEKTEAGSDEAIESHWLLAGKYADLGNQEAHDAVLTTVRETHDPGGRTVIGARAHLWKIQSDLNAGIGECHCESDDCDENCEYQHSIATLDLAPLYTHAKRVKMEEARFDAWNSIANFEITRKDTDSAVKAYEKAYDFVPKAQVVSFPKNVAMWAVESGEECTKSQKKLALKFATSAVKAAKKLDPESDAFMEAYGDYDVTAVQAEAIGALAFAYHVNGNPTKAKKTAEEALALAGEHADSYREFFSVILNS